MNTLIVFLADTFIIIFYCISGIILLWSHNHKLNVTFLLSVPIAWTIGWFIKNFFYTPRPFIVSGRPPLINFILDGSFPSQHTILAFTAAFAIIYYHNRLGLLLLFLACLIAAGRVFSGVHTWLDIFGGILISILVVFSVGKVFRTF